MCTGAAARGGQSSHCRICLLGSQDGKARAHETSRCAVLWLAVPEAAVSSSTCCAGLGHSERVWALGP